MSDSFIDGLRKRIVTSKTNDGFAFSEILPVARRGTFIIHSALYSRICSTKTYYEVESGAYLFYNSLLPPSSRKGILFVTYATPQEHPAKYRFAFANLVGWTFPASASPRRFSSSPPPPTRSCTHSLVMHCRLSLRRRRPHQILPTAVDINS